VKKYTSVDYIIVGQGLAGSAVAMQLLKRGKKILVIDEPSRNNSSRVAAGLFNPITGKNTVKTWMADDLFPCLHQYYREVEKLTGKKFFYPLPIYKPFASVKEQNEWMGLSASEAFQNYIESIFSVSPFGHKLRDPFGGMMLKQCGYLNTQAYMLAVRSLIRSTSFFIDGLFDEADLVLENDNVSYQDFRGEKIIFCQGERGVSNKWFRNLPIRPLKGETLAIKSDWKKDVILNRGVYMVPGNHPGECKIGSTYNFNDNSSEITQAGRQELIEKLEELIRLPYEIVDQDWGVRPTTPDRRPILGSHPDSEKLVIFNGLGTKGVSLAPYFSEVLIHWLEKKGTLHKAVAITRYK
jgi:glycine/D-amino acid oxidase-like deaminating enzyme